MVRTGSWQAKRGDIDPTRATINLAAMRADQRAAEAGKLEQVKKQMEALLEASPKFGDLKGQILLDMTPDALRIQIVDAQSRPMFDSGRGFRPRTASLSPSGAPCLPSRAHLLVPTSWSPPAQGSPDRMP